MKHIATFMVMIGILVTIAVLVTTLFNYRLKKYILENKQLDDNTMKILSGLNGLGPDALKWGILLFFGGLGLVVLEFIPYQSDQSPLPYGLETIFLSLGFLVYYFVSRNQKK